MLVTHAPRLCAGSDISVSDHSNANRDSYTCIGAHWRDCAYANDTTLGDFFTGAEKFTVKELEVFKIID
jgi:hypothetical protein